ncbi:MAG: thiol:disulfide interchange protein TlpA [Bosea sp. (in: a-proteobacteria)]
MRASLLFAAASLILAGAGVYALVGPSTATNAGQCRAAAATASKLKPLAKGEVAAFQVAASPKPLPELTFARPNGEAGGLADFKGRVVLLNLWATWCAPCRKEMPALDNLQGQLGNERFEVVAVNIDTRNLERPRQWLTENGITRLAYYADPKTATFQTLRQVGKAIGMPTTLLIDAEGCELGVLHGAAHWDSEDAKALIRAALEK